MTKSLTNVVADVKRSNKSRQGSVARVEANIVSQAQEDDLGRARSGISPRLKLAEPPAVQMIGYVVKSSPATP